MIFALQREGNISFFGQLVTRIFLLNNTSFWMKSSNMISILPQVHQLQTCWPQKSTNQPILSGPTKTQHLRQGGLCDRSQGGEEGQVLERCLAVPLKPWDFHIRIPKPGFLWASFIQTKSESNYDSLFCCFSNIISIMKLFNKHVCFSRRTTLGL